MSFTKETIYPVLAKALLHVNILRAAGYDAYVVGGALRVLALGGETQDVDIAVILPFDDTYALRADIDILLGRLAPYSLQHWSAYDDNQGFLADWRSLTGDINIIAYDKLHYDNVDELVAKFDLNINQYSAITNEADELINPYLCENNVVKINPERDNDYQTNRLDSRINRFKAQYPHLDWSLIDASL